MTTDDLLRRWAAGRLNVPCEDVLSVEFTHEDGWTDNGSGTSWPEENTAVVMLRSVARGEPQRPRKREFSVDGIEGLPGLLREILAVASPENEEYDNQ